MLELKVGGVVRFSKDFYDEYVKGQELIITYADTDGIKLAGSDDIWDREKLFDFVFITETFTPASDPINHPDHYQSESGIECIDAIRAALTPEEFRGYCKGAALKYIWRERKKGGDESLGKGVWYLNEAQK